MQTNTPISRILDENHIKEARDYLLLQKKEIDTNNAKFVNIDISSN